MQLLIIPPQGRFKKRGAGAAGGGIRAARAGLGRPGGGQWVARSGWRVIVCKLLLLCEGH